ncbi:MAG: endonuclease MutS2 [Planctomycetes bacterium]|nr:endonuclease MutS2 [Planctomycetota bacterium]
MSGLEVLEYPKIRALVREFASSELGRAVAQEMAPYWDAARARRALEETAELKACLIVDRVPSTGGFRDVRPHLDHVRRYGRPLEPGELYEVKELLEAARRVREHFSGGAGDGWPRLREMTQPIEVFAALIEQIGTKLDCKLGVRDDASPALARVRARLETVTTFLRNRAEELARSDRFRALLAQTRPVLRGGRFLLQVKAEHIRRVDGILHDRSQTGMTAFIEPRELVPFGNEREDLKVREAREVQQVLWDLSRAVLAEEARILATLRRVAWLDFTLAKARMAVAFDLHPPQVGGRVLALRNARHPLLLVRAGAHRAGTRCETVSPGRGFEVVPLTFRLGEDFDLLVITGPNTGGKTVAVKTVGLLALMALSGMPIPADPESSVPDYQDVLADIGDEQSIEQSLSTFSAHMTRITGILRRAGPDVLVLLDELGSGTDPAEGAALGRAILAQLVHRGAPSVVTTHLGDLKMCAYELARTENACVEFDPDNLAPTFHLRVGLPGNSNALIIAERLGLEPAVLAEARRVLADRDRRVEALIAGLQATRVETERRRQASEEMLAIARRVQADSEIAAREVGMRREELGSFADRRVDEQLREARERLYPILARLRSVPKPFDQEVLKLEKALEEALRLTPLAVRREAFVRRLRKHQMLAIARLGVRGRVVRVDWKRRLIRLVVGENWMEIPFEDVLPEEG